MRSAAGHRKALARHGYLLPGLVRQLERMHAEGRDLATRQPYGHDLDLDACIEAMVDLRTGVDPRTTVFSAFIERTRDVAVAIAIDLSSSTAERLPDSGRPGKEHHRHGHAARLGPHIVDVPGRPRRTSHRVRLHRR